MPSANVGCKSKQWRPQAEIYNLLAKLSLPFQLFGLKSQYFSGPSR
jgi:hypothetical protein